MIIKFLGEWRFGLGRVKVRGVWRPVVRTLIKNNGRWFETLGLFVATLWDTRITVGRSSNLNVYGYSRIARYGGVSSGSTFSGQLVDSFVTGNSSYLGVGPYRWVEMVVNGRVSNTSLRPIYINGIIGANVRNWRSGGKTYFQWTFPTMLPVNVEWVVKV